MVIAFGNCSGYIQCNGSTHLGERKRGFGIYSDNNTLISAHYHCNGTLYLDIIILYYETV